MAYEILFNKHKHFIFISLKREELYKSLEQRQFNANMYRHGLQEYNVYYILRQLAASKDDVDMLLERMKFEGMAEEFKQKKK